MRAAAGIVYSALALLFALAVAYLLFFLRLDGPILGYALALVFALGSAVTARSAREAFAKSRRGSVNSF